MSQTLWNAGLALGSKVIDLVSRFIPDPKQAAEAAFEIQKLIAENNAQQIEVNKLEATSSSWWVAGWRPAVGWVGVGALAWNFIVAPVATWSMQAAGLSTPPLPVIDDIMAQILVALLGINIGVRAYEKVKGVAS